MLVPFGECGAGGSVPPFPASAAPARISAPAHAMPSTRAFRRTPSASYSRWRAHAIDLPAQVARPFEVFVNGVAQKEGTDFELVGSSARLRSGRSSREGAARVLALGPDGARHRRLVQEERHDRRRLHRQRAAGRSRASRPPARRTRIRCLGTGRANLRAMQHRAVRSALAGRGFVLFPAAAFAVHQLRYELGYGSRLGRRARGAGARVPGLARALGRAAARARRSGRSWPASRVPRRARAETPPALVRDALSASPGRSCSRSTACRSGSRASFAAGHPGGLGRHLRPRRLVGGSAVRGALRRRRRCCSSPARRSSRRSRAWPRRVLRASSSCSSDLPSSCRFGSRRSPDAWRVGLRRERRDGSR